MMILANLPFLALFGGILGLVIALIAFIASIFGKRPKLTLDSLGLALACVIAVLVSFNSTYWQKPECYLPDGSLEESREECRFS